MHVGNSNWLPYWLSRAEQALHHVWISGNMHLVHLHQVQIRLLTLPLKPREDSTISPQQVYQWPIKRTCVHQKLKKKDLQLNHLTTMGEDDQVFLSPMQFASPSILIRLTIDSFINRLHIESIHLLFSRVCWEL